MVNDDGLDIPAFLDRRLVGARKQSGYRSKAHAKHRRKTAKEKRFAEYAKRKAARRRKTFEWR